MNKFKSFIFILISIFMLISCAELSNFMKEDPVMSQLLTQATISRSFEINPKWVNPAYKMTTKVIEVIDNNGINTFEELDNLIYAELSQLKNVTYEEKLLLKEFIMNRIKEQIKEFIDVDQLTGIISDEIKLQIRTVLIWINEVASRYKASGG